MKIRNIAFMITMLVIISVQGCIPSEDEIIDECQTFVDQAEHRCTEEIDRALQEFQKWFEAEVPKITTNTLTDFGCVVIPITEQNPSGWDCSEAFFCQ
jgi:Tfp pilus assembly protein PilP